MSRKTSFITAAAIAGVVLTGTTAMAANLGMLNSDDGQSAGDSPSASVVLTSPVDATPIAVDPQIVDVYIEDPMVGTTVPLVAATLPGDLSQVFSVEAAGTVTVEPTATGVMLDGVTVGEGWAWTAVQSSPNELEVTFTSGDTTYVFSASLGVDGVITAGVDQPIVQVVQAQAPTSGSSSSSETAPAAQASPSAAPAAPTVTQYQDDDHSESHDDEDGEHDD